LKDCSEDWITNVAQCVSNIKYMRYRRGQDDYLLTNEQIDRVIWSDTIYIGLTEPQATIILDMIDIIISKYVESKKDSV